MTFLGTEGASCHQGDATESVQTIITFSCIGRHWEPRRIISRETRATFAPIVTVTNHITDKQNRFQNTKNIFKYE